jgi:Tfp pilus assembly protein PilX
MKKKNSESGQALVLVLLALAVVLTIVLFILSRSITDISISSAGSSAVSAFSAAEAGVEQALVIGSATGVTTPIGDANYKANVTNVAQGTTGFVYPVDLNTGDSMTLWLKAQDSASTDFTGSTLKICWGKSGTASDSSVTPAVETVLFYETSAGVPATTRIFRAAFDSNAARVFSNHFAVPATPGSCAGQSFQFSTTLDLATLPNPQFVFVRMFYNTDTSQPVAFEGPSGSVFPSQGILVDSSGTAAQSVRKVEVFQGWPEIPNPFQFAIYSSTGLTK